MAWFEIELFPVGRSALVYASDIITAAESASEAFGPARDAIVVARYDTETVPEASIEPLPVRIRLNQPVPVVHFVGFRNDREWQNAARLYGEPDFVHRFWDQRAQCEIMDGDLLVFAKYDPARPSPYNHDDSNEPDDPAAKERL